MGKNEQKTMKNGRKWTKMDENGRKTGKNGQKWTKMIKIRKTKN